MHPAIAAFVSALVVFHILTEVTFASPRGLPSGLRARLGNRGLAALQRPAGNEHLGWCVNFDPLNKADVEEFLKRDKMTARDLSVEEHGSVQKAAELYLGKLSEADPTKRGGALGDLIALARDEDLPRIQTELEKADIFTLDAATDGMRHVPHEKVASAKFRAGLVDALVKTMQKHVGTSRMRIALQLDPVKSGPEIVKHVHWSKDSRELPELLRLFAELSARVPVEKLRELAAQLPAGNDQEAWCTYGVFLAVYALVAPAEAEPLILKALKTHPHRKASDDVDDELAKALCAARGIPNPYDRIIDRYHAIGFAKLSKAERTYLAVMLFRLAEDGAGYVPFLEDYADEMWNDLRAAMVELKEAEYLKLMDSWSAVFVGKKPGEPGFNFEAAEEAFTKKTGKDLHEQLGRISKSRDFEANLDRAIHFWAAEHAIEFRAAWEPR